MEATVRLQNELKSFHKQRPFGFYARPSSASIFLWNCQIFHQGYFFGLTMTFTKEYPLSPPRIKFDKKMYHPNIYSDNSVCLDILSLKWSPSLTILDILNGLKQLLDFPNPASPANSGAAAIYSTNRAKYNEKVKEHNNKLYLCYNTIDDKKAKK